MPAQDFSEESCESLFSVSKVTASQIAWRAINGSTIRFEAKVLCPDGTVLDLYGHWCRNQYQGTIRWGFSLKYGGYYIRSYDMASKHKNPGEGWVRGPHKHRFKTTKIPRYAYKPDPPISEENPNEALIDFLKEANIELRSGDYQNYLFPSSSI